MLFEVGRIPGVPGAVFSDFSLWSGRTFIVEGQRYQPRGFFRRRVTLPGIPENVDATLNGFLPGAQTLVAAGTTYRIGPRVPRDLQILAVLPLLLILLVKGGPGILVAGVAFSVNTKILMSSGSDVTKAGLLIATLVFGASLNVALAIALHAAWWM
ncbi:hypothetical protein [Terrabacter sp. BE26]|uniref:hypothetical protein n=1 Tax=Terrabacter sp. BE26 TaxID=2898152 RepID=UPI0035BE60BE